MDREELSYLKRRVMAFAMRGNGAVTRSKLTARLHRFPRDDRQHAIQQLLDEGLVIREIGVTRTGPRTHVYVVTEKGKRAWAKWKESGLVA